MNDQQIEQEIQARGLTTGRRITPEDIQANITDEVYFTAQEGYNGHLQARYPRSGVQHGYPLLAQITICVLVLRNGYTVVGINQGPVSPENFDAEMGRKLARQKAVDQVWVLMGYELKSELCRPVLTEADALADLEGRARPHN